MELISMNEKRVKVKVSREIYDLITKNNIDVDKVILNYLKKLN